jgi:hypothetical protein
MLSAGTRLNTKAVQAAMGIYSTKVAPGQSFEILILLQNSYDQKVEGTVTLHVPKRDTLGTVFSRGGREFPSPARRLLLTVAFYPF